MTQWILSAEGKPFSDRSAALIKREMLARELGQGVPLEVVPHPGGGFVVAAGSPGRSALDSGAENEAFDLALLDPSGPSDVPHRRDSNGEICSPNSTGADHRSVQARGESTHSNGVQPSVARSAQAREDMRQHVRGETRAQAAERSMPVQNYPERFRLSPAPRAFLVQHVLAVLGVVLLFQPHRVLQVIGAQPSPESTATAFVLILIALAGLLLMLFASSRWLWAYTANTYCVDGDGVEQVQWYWDRWRLRRHAARVNFMHLRAADVEQSMMQMLLNVGSVKLATGGTDGYEVVLTHVSVPRALSAEFQMRARHLSGAGIATAREVRR